MWGYSRGCEWLHGKGTCQTLPGLGDQGLHQQWWIMLISHIPDIMWSERHFISIMPLQTQKSSVTKGKTSHRSKSKNILQTTWVVLLKTFEVMQQTERPRNICRQEEAKET